MISLMPSKIITVVWIFLQDLQRFFISAPGGTACSVRLRAFKRLCSGQLLQRHKTPCLPDLREQWGGSDTGDSFI
jgi:hypothetical protein